MDRDLPDWSAYALDAGDTDALGDLFPLCTHVPALPLYRMEADAGDYR